MRSASRQLLACRRANGSDDSLPTVKKAEREAEQDEAASAGYARQKSFDHTVGLALDEAQPPAELRQEIANTWRETLSHRPAGKNLLLHPAFLCGIVAIIGIVVVFVLVPRSDQHKFQGDEEVRMLVERASHTPNAEMEIVDGPVGELGDFLFMKGIEHFTAPPQFADFRAERVKIHTFAQQPVAQIASDDKLTFLVFEEGVYDMKLDPDGKWYLIEEKGRVAVVRKIDGVVFIAIRPGSSEVLAKKVELADFAAK